MTIQLSKGQSLSLRKQDGVKLDHIMLGLGWDVVKKGWFGHTKDIDLDASAILFDANKKEVDKVWYSHLSSKDRSVKHSGDNLTGAGDGDDEQIHVRLSSVPANVTDIVFTITSYSGQKFTEVENVFARVVDIDHNEEFVNYNLNNIGPNTAVIVAKITRSGDSWEFTAIGNPANGSTVKKVIKDAQNAL